MPCPWQRNVQKVAVWLTAQASGDGCHRPLVTLPKEVQNPSINETKLNISGIYLVLNICLPYKWHKSTDITIFYFLLSLLNTLV